MQSIRRSEYEKKLPIGVSNFIDVITDHGYYVDKTMLVADWLQTIRGTVTLLTRPRRFGKTLNMTMLREFFDITRDSTALFAELSISKTEYVAEINQWPVIYLSFKDCKGSYDGAMTCIYKALLEAFKPVVNNDLPEIEKTTMLNKTLHVLMEFDFEQQALVQDAIYTLSHLLYLQYHQKVIILIDEYDTPMISAYEQQYYDKIHFFFGSLYGSALKDNPYLERAMLTGIHRIAKENIFSGLNNLSVCTVLDESYNQYFGLTPVEIETLLTYYDLPLDEEVKSMYDGYRFGGQEIYNPWSILNYAQKKKLASYWVNTASNEMLVQTVLSADLVTKNNFERLLSEGQVIVSVDLQTSFFELNQAATLWGLFLNSGYLTILRITEEHGLQTEVGIPNQEVRTSFRKIVERYI